MAEAVPSDDAPEYVIQTIAGMCQLFRSGLRVYGHPHLLAVAEAINGPDFVPYNDAIFVKQPGLGGSVAWHQDGVTHWDSPDWDEGHPRCQLPGPTQPDVGVELPMGRAGNAQARPGRHQCDGRSQWRLGSTARCHSPALRARRRDHRQPADPAQQLREYVGPTSGSPFRGACTGARQSRGSTAT